MWWGNHTSRNIDIEAGVKMAWTGLNLTNDGRRILNKAQLNNRLNFKSIVIGDGNAPANFNAQKKLVHQLYELTDLKISIEDDVCILMTDLPVVDYDYYLREIGVIVTTDDGDKLYAYDNCGGDAQYVINTAGIERTEKRVRLALTVSGVENITVSVPSNLYVDYKDYENTIADIRQSKIDGAGGDISDTVSSFKQTDILENIKSGEKTGQIFGKVSKAINVLISHLADNVRHITAGERSLWNTVKNKVDIIPGKGLSTNDYTTVEKNKLSGIADKANNYVHPVSHPADIITQDATHRFVSDDEKKVWNTNKSNVDTHVSNNTIHITSQERTQWNKVTDKLDKTGGAISGDIVPDKTEAYDLGHEDKKWDNVWVETLEAGYVNAKEGIQGNLTGNAASAAKLVTARNINGAKFDGTSDIQLPLYYSYSFGTTENAIYYSSFCKMKKDNVTSECQTTLLLSATGNFGGTIPGTYLISMSNRGQKATMTVVCLQKSSQSDLTFGYYSDDTYFYFGVIRPTYSYSTNLTVLSKSASAETGKFLNSTTKPKNWVDVKITNSIGGNASTVNGHTVNANVPANAKFTDTNTTYPIYNKTINGSYTTAFRTQTKGNATHGDFISTIRNDTANVAGSPQYSSGIAFGRNDTHGYLNINYNSEQAYIGGGNGDKLNWYKAISLDGHTHNFLLDSNDSRHINFAYSKANVSYDVDNLYLACWVGGTTPELRAMNKSTFAKSSHTHSYNDLSNKPTIPSVGNGTVTITQNGTKKGSFTMNQSGNATIALSDNNDRTSVTTKSTNGNNVKGTYKCLTLSDGSTKILYGKTNATIVNLTEPYGSAYWKDIYIDLPSYFNTITYVGITPFLPSTGLLNVQHMGNTPQTNLLALRVFGAKNETITCFFTICIMGY